MVDSGAGRASAIKWALPGILLLAALLRALAAAAPGFHHPDAVYQYLEPAYRLVTGEGVVTWEWRVGMRSWLMPILLAGPLWLGEQLTPNGALRVLLPRLTMAGASLGIVWAAWQLGGRVSRQGALLACFVAAIWVEFIHFGAQTLAEPLATAAFLPAAALVTRVLPSRRALGAAGALLAGAVLMRPHYAPAAAALVLVAAWPGVMAQGRGAGPWLALILGGLGILIVSAGIDMAAGTRPFAWAVENVRQNIVEHRAAGYGVLPPLTYVTWFMTLWQWWTVPLLVGVRFGWRYCPALGIAALINLVLHSLIGHKEYRFVFLTAAALVILSAVGWAVLLQHVSQRWPGRRARIATAFVATAWAAASLLLATSDRMNDFIESGRPGSIMFAALRDDRATCGIALVDRPAFAEVPGRVSLRRGTPLFMFLRGDPAFGRGDAWDAARQWSPGFNRILATLPVRALPPGYRRLRCEPAGIYTLCLFARPGPCADASASPFQLDRAMRRRDF